VTENEVQTTYTLKMLKDRLQPQMESNAFDTSLGLAFYNSAVRKAQIKEKTSFRSYKSKSSRLGIDGKDLSFEELCKVNKLT